eukprot:6023188-Pyramimonas_sp.AAC.1
MRSRSKTALSRSKVLDVERVEDSSAESADEGQVSEQMDQATRASLAVQRIDDLDEEQLLQLTTKIDQADQGVRIGLASQQARELLAQREAMEKAQQEAPASGGAMSSGEPRGAGGEPSGGPGGEPSGAEASEPSSAEASGEPGSG